MHVCNQNVYPNAGNQIGLLVVGVDPSWKVSGVGQRDRGHPNQRAHQLEGAGRASERVAWARQHVPGAPGRLWGLVARARLATLYL